jgi:hypothetical protein
MAMRKLKIGPPLLFCRESEGLISLLDDTEGSLLTAYNCNIIHKRRQLPELGQKRRKNQVLSGWQKLAGKAREGGIPSSRAEVP